jgi:hypothetical protein
MKERQKDRTKCSTHRLLDRGGLDQRLHGHHTTAITITTLGKNSAENHDGFASSHHDVLFCIIHHPPWEILGLIMIRTD